MKITQNKQLFIIFIAINILIMSQISMAASFTVKKVKGKQALIEYTGSALEDGKTYKISRPNEEKSNSNTNRDHFLIIREFTFSNLASAISGTSAGRSSRLSLHVGYGWNKESFEFAPIFGFETSDTGSGANTTFTIGALADYNFTQNTTDVFSIFGLGIDTTYSKTNSADSGSSPSKLQAFALLFWKWFLFENSVCIKTDLGYLHSKTSSTTETTTTGFYGRGNFIVYF